MPIISHNIWENAKQERIRNIKHKLSKSTDTMLATSGLNGYSSTEDFINTFKRHMKITQICKPNEIQKCWGSKTVITGNDGKTWDIAKTTSTKDLKISSDNSGYKDIMGIVTADGTPMIIAYNTDCDITLKNGRVWNEEQSSSTGCLSGIFDWNGGKKPNKLGVDVLNINASAGLGQTCSIDLNSSCLQMPQIVDRGMTSAECNAKKSSLGIKNCGSNNDYWARAAEICGGVKNMASMEDLVLLAKKIYPSVSDVNTSQGSWTYCKNNSNCRDDDVLTQLSIPANKMTGSGGAWFYSSEEKSSGYAYAIGFRSSSIEIYNANDSRYYSNFIMALCKQ